MIRFFIISTFIFFQSNTKAINMNDIQQLRKEFNLAIEDGKKANNLFDQLVKLKPANNTLQFAYLGATEALLAKHSYNPFSKLSYVNSALIKLNKAVELNNGNIEIRYMRFSVEANMPAYLGYSKHVDEDKKVLIQGLSTTPITVENCAMYLVFINGIINSNHCNKEEKILLSNIEAICKKAQLIKN
jgi:hypothetical protein